MRMSSSNSDRTMRPRGWTDRLGTSPLALTTAARRNDLRVLSPPAAKHQQRNTPPSRFRRSGGRRKHLRFGSKTKNSKRWNEEEPPEWAEGEEAFEATDSLQATDEANSQSWSVPTSVNGVHSFAFHPFFGLRYQDRPSVVQQSQPTKPRSLPLLPPLVHPSSPFQVSEPARRRGKSSRYDVAESSQHGRCQSCGSFVALRDELDELSSAGREENADFLLCPYCIGVKKALSHKLTSTELFERNQARKAQRKAQRWQ